MDANRAELCELMDKLYIQSLELMEQDVRLKIAIENLTNEGQLLLAQTRFTKGSNAVSAVQLPTEDYRDFNALRTVKETRDAQHNVRLELESHPVDKERSFIDPLRWFGILLPQSLAGAKEKFARSLEYIVEAANVQLQLGGHLRTFAKLNKMKEKL